MALRVYFYWPSVGPVLDRSRPRKTGDNEPDAAGHTTNPAALHGFVRSAWRTRNNWDENGRPDQAAVKVRLGKLEGFSARFGRREMVYRYR